ncbi:MAG: GDSL-type esterase/lipase family protein [Pirellulaceae bacterium]|nr:GDSL-type esterase/lipase family protein [Pirellulaceae bacterium]
MSRSLTTRKKLCFALLVTVVSVGSMEIGARLWLSLLTPSSTQLNVGTENDRLVQTMRGDLENEQQGQQLYATDPQLFWKLQPQVQLRVRNNVYQMTGEPVYWTIQTNREGFRGVSVPPGGAPAAPLVLCLGDSCTFGFRVDQEQTYPNQLQAYLRSQGLPGAVVLNCGVPGYSSFQGARLARQLLSQVRPDFVVIAFGANDLEQALRSDQQRGELTGQVPGMISGLRSRLAVARLYDRLFRSQRVAPEVNSQAMFRRVNQQEYESNLSSMITAAQEVGAEVMVQDLVFVAPVYAAQIGRLVQQKQVAYLDGRQLLAEGLKEIMSGTRFQEQRAAIDRFWDVELAKYNFVYYSERYYQQLLNIPQWQGYLRYLLVEPVHPSPLGHQLISEQVGQWILSKSGDPQ